MTVRACAIIGVSGPDGAGKTTVVRALTADLRASGTEPVHTYLYGCAVCRRAGRAASARMQRGAQRVHAAGALHALVDATELAVRLAAVRLRARGRPVLTDRSPLDGLAKHDPSPRSIAARMFLRSARAYEIIALLDAPAATLCARDGEHGIEEMERARAAFARWAAVLANVDMVTTEGRSTEEVASGIGARGAAPGGREPDREGDHS